MQYYPERIHPQDLKKIGAIASTTDQMIRLVEDLLLLARMDTINLLETEQWVNLSLTEILEDLLELFQCQAQEKGISLLWNFPGEIKVKGDGRQISRIFRNLLENALQYTPSGGKVTLTVKCDRDNAMIMVQDTGIGIAPEDLLLIFDRFWRADKARERRAGGMGMGLAITQALVRRYQGQISVSSQLSVGTCFRVRLPLH
jgi:signal transduction histidine kinase